MQISQTVLYNEVTEKLGYHKFCALWVPKVHSENYKTQRMGSALDFHSHYDVEGIMFLSKIKMGYKMLGSVHKC